MTIFRTLKMRGHNPMQVLVHALKAHVRSGQLPPLPKKSRQSAEGLNIR